jgi:hypothetical protein
MSQTQDTARSGVPVVPRIAGSEVGLRITPRTIQVLLGLIWLLDGALQFQPYMFSNNFLNQTIGSMAPGQPSVIGQPIVWIVSLFHPIHGFMNVLFALTQVAIGLGLIVSRRTVKPALILSFAWAFIVWWFGEGFGMLGMGMANPLTGAPGPAAVYALIGLMVWPTGRPQGESAAAGGPLGDWGGRIAWTVIWVLFAVLMLLPVNREADAFKTTFSTAAGSAPGPLVGLDNALASGLAGHGLIAAYLLGIVMVVIGIGVLAEWSRNPVLILGSVLALAFWLTAQYLGGMLTGQGTDPNSGPILVLLALTVYRFGVPAAAEVRRQ